jgi:WD40 repeat protein
MPGPQSFRVFVSAVSGELQSYRKEAVRVLRRKEHDVRDQEHFRLSSGTLLEKLSNYIARCNAVLALVGERCGSFPTPEHVRALGPIPVYEDYLRASGQTRCSYTQWEILLALHFGKPLYFFFSPDMGFRPDSPNPEDADLQASQRAFRNWLENRGVDRLPLTSTQQLAEDVAVLPLPDLSAPAPPVFKGLRAYEAGDKDFFLRLLPGEKDRDGLPEPIRTWKQRIESRQPAFTVGVLYGPSGCGKSSLVKAGLLPHLAALIVPLEIAAGAGDTEARLLHALHRSRPALRDRRTLADALAAVAQGQGLEPGQKLLILLDQFEQWLHARRGQDQAELAEALRLCNGETLQCLLLVRDDFWTALTSFLQLIPVELDTGHNATMVGLFSVSHTRYLLTVFGQAFGKIAASPVPEQQAFIDEAASGISESAWVVPVRLALFLEMVKDKDWAPETLRKLGGALGAGLAFFEETFNGKNAPRPYRDHAYAAQQVLQALLPKEGSTIKGAKCSDGELIQAAGDARVFESLRRILDDQLRLMTPTEIDEPGAGATVSGASGQERFYQLTHDYLVPSLREWLNREIAKTPRGRAGLLLKERAGLWSRRAENRYLPSLSECVRFRLLTDAARWSDVETSMMRTAYHFHLVRTVPPLLLLVLALGGLATLAWRKWQDAAVARAARRVEGYFNTVGLAEREWRSNHVERARALLQSDDCPPALRGREWAYLSRLFYPNRPSLSQLSAPAAVAFNAEGQVVAVTRAREGEPTRVTVWDFDRNQVKERLLRNGVVRCARFSPDGRFLAMAFEDGDALLILDVSKGTEVPFETGDADPREDERPAEVCALGFSSDGARLAIAKVDRFGQKDQRRATVTIADRRGDRYAPCTQLAVDANEVSGLALRADGGELVCGGTNASSGVLDLWVLPDGKGETAAARRLFRAPRSNRVRAVAFSPNGQELASAEEDLGVKIWDCATGRIKISFFGQSRPVLSLAMNGSLLAAAGEDQTIKVWNAERGEELFTLRDHTGSVTCLAFSLYEARLVSGALDQTVKVWEASSFDKMPEVLWSENHSWTGLALASSPAGDRLASVDDGDEARVYVWDLRARQQVPKTLPGRRCVAYSPDGLWLATAGDGGRIRLYNMADERKVFKDEAPACEWPAHQGRVNALAYSPDAKLPRLASVGADKVTRVWQVIVGAPGAGTTIRRVAELANDREPTSVAFAANGRWVAYGCADKQVKVWDVQTGTVMPMQTATSYAIQHVAISDTLEFIAAACGEPGGGQFVVWRAGDGAEVQASPAQGEPLRWVGLTRDSKRLAAGGDDGRLLLYDVATGRQVLALDESAWPLSAGAFSSDGNLLATGNNYGTIRLYRVRPDDSANPVHRRQP